MSFVYISYIIIIHRLYFIYTFEGMEYIFYLFTPHIYLYMHLRHAIWLDTFMCYEGDT